jgi:hypothetical protein
MDNPIENKIASRHAIRLKKESQIFEGARDGDNNGVRDEERLRENAKVSGTHQDLGRGLKGSTGVARECIP